MRGMVHGLVSASRSYEREGHIVHSVSVACDRSAFNVGVENCLDWYEGDSVLLIGDFGVGKTGLYCMDSRIELASEEDRCRLGAEVRRRPTVTVSSKPSDAELAASRVK